MSQNKNYAFLQFTPMQSGSIREKTKTFTPNEGDITCVVDDTTGLKILDETKSQSTIKVNRKVANRGWVELCLDNFILCPKLLSAFFTRVLKEIMNKRSSILLKHFAFSVHSLQKKDKISCFHFLFRNDVVKDLVISVDFVLAIPHPEYKLEHELPLQAQGEEKETCKFYLIPKVSQRKEVTSKNAYFLVSYSDLESRFVNGLSQNIKNGFIYAKAARNASLCSLPSELAAKVLEPLCVEDYVTTYMLKTCLMFAMSDNEYLSALIARIFLLTKCAYLLYVILVYFVKEKGKLPFFFDKSIDLFQCHHQFDTEYDDKLGCCLKRALIVGFSEGIMQCLKNLIPNAEQLKREFIWRIKYAYK